MKSMAVHAASLLHNKQKGKIRYFYIPHGSHYSISLNLIFLIFYWLQDFDQNGRYAYQLSQVLKFLFHNIIFPYSSLPNIHPISSCHQSQEAKSM